MRAELPAEVPRGAFGPRLQAAIATLAVRNRVSRRDTVELLGELFGAELSTGRSSNVLSSLLSGSIRLRRRARSPSRR